jgi:hypothetical protein
MDTQLHAERLVPGTRRQHTTPALAGDLPDGVMIAHEGVVGLLAGGRLLPWSFGGYLPPVTLPVPAPVDLLTPPSSAAVLQAGYLPLLHPTAGAVHVVRLSPGQAGWPHAVMRPRRAHCSMQRCGTRAKVHAHRARG